VTKLRAGGLGFWVCVPTRDRGLINSTTFTPNQLPIERVSGTVFTRLMVGRVVGVWEWSAKILRWPFVPVWFLYYLARFQASAAKEMRMAFFWIITQRVRVITSRRFGTSCRFKDRLPETSVKNFRYLLRNNPEESRSHLYHIVFILPYFYIFSIIRPFCITLFLYYLVSRLPFFYVNFFLLPSFCVTLLLCCIFIFYPISKLPCFYILFFL